MKDGEEKKYIKQTSSQLSWFGFFLFHFGAFKYFFLMKTCGYICWWLTAPYLVVCVQEVLELWILRSTMRWNCVHCPNDRINIKYIYEYVNVMRMAPTSRSRTLNVNTSNKISIHSCNVIFVWLLELTAVLSLRFYLRNRHWCRTRWQFEVDFCWRKKKTIETWGFFFFFQTCTN